MKKIMITAFISTCIFIVPLTGLACTAFMLDNSSQPVYGKNHDALHMPSFLIVNKRGVAKTSAFLLQEPDAEHISWTSRFGSVTFNSLAREWPFDGINEAGLFIVTLGNMVLAQTAYPEPDSRPPLGAKQWIQYQLDNFSTVDEVIASDPGIRISRPRKNITTLWAHHFLVGDSRGNCASIEFIDGEMVWHAGPDMSFKVLSNNPYDLSVAVLGLFQGFGGFFPIPHPIDDRLSLIRFAIAADMVQKYSPRDSGFAVDYAFQILEDVEITPAHDTATWSVVYDSSNRQIYFHPWSDDRIRRINLSALDFSCTTPVKVLDITADLSGEVSNSFADYTKEIELEMISAWGFSDETIEMVLSYPDTTVCTTDTDNTTAANMQ